MRYSILTWDPDLRRYTPQLGVRTPVTGLHGLKVAIRLLRRMGYSCTRDDSFVLVRRCGK